MSELPEEISALRSLSKLHLQRNQLKVFPDALARVSSLREVDVSSNAIWSLPGATIAQLRFLTALDLSNNNIRCARARP